MAPTLDFQIDPDYGVKDPQFRRTMSGLLGPTLVSGNEVELLVNGNEIFPAMLEAIRGAQKTITLETFIYWSGKIGQTFADLLSEKARQGVRVHVLLDWLGSNRLDAEMIRQMRESGVEVLRYHPPRWWQLRKLNRRTHRKLMVVDGKVGFTGGVGIADAWMGNAEHPDEWRDNHYRIEGPIVAQVQQAFMDNWMRTRRKVLHSEAYYPQLEVKGGLDAQVFMSSSRDGSDSIYLLFAYALSLARESLYLASAYFMPDEVMVRKLIEAKQRGVTVEIIVPGERIDHQIVRRATRSLWGELLRHGIQIYEYEPTMFHVKTMVVDEYWTSVGSTNFDNRSFKLNDEANLNVFDHEFARRHIEHFKQDRRNAKRITYDDWKKRPLVEKIMERLAGMTGSQL